MIPTVIIETLNEAAFAPFGDIVAASGDPTKMINQRRCGRYHDRAQLDVTDGQAGISIFQSELCTLPYTLELMERHPDGSQAFAPLSADGFLVIVAPNDGGTPGHPRAFITEPGQVINFHRNTWHGVLTPLSGSGLFAVIDRIGDGPNLEEHWFDTPYIVKSDI